MSCATLYVSRLGAHHFAHLRGIAEGLDLVATAKRYLGIEHGHQARAAHQQAQDAVRAIARRQGVSAWRLIGLSLATNTLRDAKTPSLDEFIESRDLDDWSESEVLKMYQEAFPVDIKTQRRQRVRERLRTRLLDTLRELEALAAEKPQLADAISGWFDTTTAAKLFAADMVILADLASRIAAGGRWWRVLPAIGQIKAARITAHLELLLPNSTTPVKPVFALALPSIEPQTTVTSAQGDGSLLNVSSDQAAVEAWIAARAGAIETVKVYRREARRLLLWLHHEKNGAAFANMQVTDCRDYMTFLQHVPDQWISRVHSSPGTQGWAPFRGRLSTHSVRQAITIIASMFQWLQAANYLQNNPWLLVNQKIGDDKESRVLQSKALSAVALRCVIDYCLARLPAPAAHRMLFIARFLSSVGLRSAELLSANLSDVQHEEEGWVMQVQGKGSKNRIAALPASALEALNTYLMARGLGDITQAPPAAPILASLADPMVTVGYQALYTHVKAWLRKAIQSADLPASERIRMSQASTHWLRHTFGTQAIAKEVPLDVIQAQMGHASIQTTTATYGRAPIRRRIDELGKAFG